ncbi:hypothetical protein BKI52_19795 [marine bacterium AO1-C]|nr:hypothetical protein BKI52_19795 [marine bacterium AO1-C]
MKTKQVLTSFVGIFSLILLTNQTLFAQAKAFGSPGQHTPVSLQNPANPTGYGYYEYLPFGYDETSGQKYRLLIWLHGKGEGGNGVPMGEVYSNKSGSFTQAGNLNKVLKNGIPDLINDNTDNNPGNDLHLDNCIVISPQKFTTKTSNLPVWQVSEVNAIINAFVAHYPVDANKIYIAGFSAGANVLVNYVKNNRSTPENTLPAAYFISGPTNPKFAIAGEYDYFQNIGFWFHTNREDSFNTYPKARKSVITITGSGSNVIQAPGDEQTEVLKHYRFVGGSWLGEQVINIDGADASSKSFTMLTSYRDLGHNPATRLLMNNPKVYEWLFSFTRNGSTTSTVTTNAGSDDTITLPTSSYSLNGTATSSDATATLTYAWTQISGPGTATFSNPALANSTVTGLLEGTYVFRLTASDSNGATNADDVTITVLPLPNMPPVANAGVDLSITLPTNTIALDGSASNDDIGIVAYAWSQVSGPNTASFDDASLVTPTVSGLVMGNYVFRLMVTDGSGASSTDDVTVTVQPAPTPLDRVFNINFTLPSLTPAGSDWNATDGSLHAGYTLENLLDNQGNVSSVTMEFLDIWPTSKAGGTTTIDEGIFPNAVREGVYYTKNTDGSNANNIKFSGLNPAETYTFTILSSRITNGDKTTVFSYNGTTASVNASNNVNNYAVLPHLAPNASGEIMLNIKTGGAATFTYLNGLIIESSSFGGAKVKVNFTLPSIASAGTDWNETDGSFNTGYQLNNLVNDHATTTSINMELLDAWTNRNNKGKTTINEGLFPNEVREGVYQLNAGDAVRLKFSGLNPGTTYRFTFLSSRASGGDKTTTFSNGTTNIAINSSYNIDNYAVFAGLMPNADGEIVITVGLGATATQGFLNGIIIEANPGGAASRNTKTSTSILPISAITVYPNPTNGVVHYKSSEKVMQVNVMDLKGRLVRQFGVEDVAHRSINLRTLREGVYILEFRTKQGSEFVRVLKK